MKNKAEQLDLVELEKHLETLKKYQLRPMPDDIKQCLEDEISFWELKLEELK